MPGEIPPAAFTLEWRFVSDGSRGRFGVSESASDIQEPDYSRLPAGFRKENEGYQLLSDRIRRAQARECLRTLLMHWGTFTPEGWNHWQSGTYGKPSIPDAGDFSLTHAAGFAAALLAPKPEEGACRLPLAACSRAYALWTRKEAVLKAGGWGCATKLRIWMCSLRRFTFSDAAGIGKRCS